ncbi:hypothetical protein [Streptomyces sp. 3N207]|uniref:hypothetical protein n=1 Tax=Streptomyces sp. 3N207 TaxID=3457417 RepID=UPI003FD143BB
MNEYERWQNLVVRAPGDVPSATPLSWQAEKESDHAQKLFANQLPAEAPYRVERGAAGDALAALALRESMRRNMENDRGYRVHEALTLGATWAQVAAALDVGRPRPALSCSSTSTVSATGG